MISSDENLLNNKNEDSTNNFHESIIFKTDINILNKAINQSCLKLNQNKSKKKEINLLICSQDAQNLPNLIDDFKQVPQNLKKKKIFLDKKLIDQKKITKNKISTKTSCNHQNLDDFYKKKKKFACNSDLEITKNLSPIIRQPKLKINDKTLRKLRSETDDLVFEELIEINNMKQNGRNQLSDNKHEKNNHSIKRESNKFKSIICPICNTKKKYKDPRKRFGIVCCASCYGFFRNFIRKPKQYYCLAIGDCQLQSQELEVNFKKCKACWLKNCLQKFTLEQKIHDNLTEKYSPRLQSSPNVMLITLDTNSNSSMPEIKSSNLFASNIKTSLTNTLLIPVFNETCNKSYSNIFKNSTLYNNEFNSYSALGYKGPRVKRVCRSINDVYRGLPRAVFPTNIISTNNSIKNYLDSPSKIENKKSNKNNEATTSKIINVNLSKEDDSDYLYDSDDLPITEYIARNIKKEMLESKNVSV